MHMSGLCPCELESTQLKKNSPGTYFPTHWCEDFYLLFLDSIVRMAVGRNNGTKRAT